MTSYYLFSEDVLDKVVRISDHRSINEKGKYSILYDNQNVDVEWIVEKMKYIMQLSTGCRS